MMFDMEKFFDTIDPGPLLDAIVQAKFPPVDTLMGLQMHWAPRVIQVQALTGPHIRVDKSILAGCLYSVPFVKALMHA